MKDDGKSGSGVRVHDGIFVQSGSDASCFSYGPPNLESQVFPGVVLHTELDLDPEVQQTVGVNVSTSRFQLQERIRKKHQQRRLATHGDTKGRENERNSSSVSGL